MSTGAPYVNPDPGYCSVTDTDTTLSSSLGPDDTMAPVAAQSTHVCIAPAVTWPSDKLRLQSRYQASVLALVATWATDFNTEPVLKQGYKPRHGLGQQLGLVDILAPSGCPGNLD